MLRARWLGRVPYLEADQLQRAFHARAADDYLLLLEHPPVYTLGTTADPAHVLVPAPRVGAELVHADRGGDVTYHGPGQLVGYPIVTLPHWRNGLRDVVGYVRTLEAVLIDALGDLGVSAGRVSRYPGVWVGDEKIAAVGVKVAGGRTRHGFALNVAPDLSMFEHIVPCGIRDRGVTSLESALGKAPDMHRVVDAVVEHFARHFGDGTVERQDVVWRERAEDLSPFTLEAGRGTPARLLGRLAEAGVAPAGGAGGRRPPWMRVRADLGAGFRETKRLMRRLDLRTVCEEAGCPNIYECWADHTATFMILGDRCTRACGFCLVDTRKPFALDPHEPARVADAVAHLGLEHAVITSVARDDLDDGGAGAFAATIRAVRARTPATSIEVLVPDCKGDQRALDAIFSARPDVLNHNLETVARLQRAARPSAAYFRSLALLARAKDAGLRTKSGIILGMGETADELRGAIADLRNVGVDVLTLGQYLQPSARHLPVVRWWTPDEFAALGDYAEGLGFDHVESGPLVRSSYHAKRAATPATTRTCVSTPRTTRSPDASSVVGA
ncbi:MAG TPA: lipoyl synthase [Acidimicrobiia bacterium]|nr:lipoyl synthase [Acidimicrobiia bacterium]